MKKTATQASAKKAPMSSLVVKEGEGAWSWSAVEELWDELRQASPSAELVMEGRIVMAGSLADRGRSSRKRWPSCSRRQRAAAGAGPPSAGLVRARRPLRPRR